MSSSGALPGLLCQQLELDDFKRFLMHKKRMAHGKMRGIAVGEMAAVATCGLAAPTFGPGTFRCQARWQDARGTMRKPFVKRHRWFEPLQHDDLASLVHKMRRQVHYGHDATRPYSGGPLEADKCAAEVWKRLHTVLREISLASSEEARRSAPRDPIDREIETFDRMKPQLLQQYEGKYVAVLEGEVRDADSDKRELARRVYGRFGMVPILIRQVLRQEPEPKPLPFPERG